MGMFDSIWVKCPECGEKNEFQSKSGDCVLGDYTLENCPEDVIADANRHSPNLCDCGAMLEIDIARRKVVSSGGGPKRKEGCPYCDKTASRLNSLCETHWAKFLEFEKQSQTPNL